MSRLIRVTRFASGLFVLLAVSPAGAQSGQNQTAAQALYDEGRRLMEAKDFGEACPKFKESYSLDPGGGTLLNLADCYEKAGKPALAWTTFKEALVIAERDANAPRVEFAKSHLAALEPKLSYVTVNVAEGARVDGLAVTVDGTALGSAAWGMALPVDPGKHVIRAEASGHTPFEQALDIPASGGAKEVLVVPVLEPLAPGANSESKSEPQDKGEATASSGSGTRTLGWVTLGVGAVGVGVGSFFGLKAFSEWSDREDACKGGCTPEAKAAGSRASDAATISTIAFAVGVGAIGVGAVLVLTSGGGDKQQGESAPLFEARVTPLPGGGNLSVRHAW